MDSELSAALFILVGTGVALAGLFVGARFAHRRGYTGRRRKYIALTCMVSAMVLAMDPWIYPADWLLLFPLIYSVQVIGGVSMLAFYDVLFSGLRFVWGKLRDKN